jgi:hypothetical protein
MPLVNTTIGATETTILTVPGGQSWANVFLSFCCFNTSSSEMITVHVRPAGEAVSDENTVLKNVVIDPTDTFVLNMEKFLLSATDVISAIGSAGGRVSVTASYLAL